jgi:hypothetical protein
MQAQMEVKMHAQVEVKAQEHLEVKMQPFQEQLEALKLRETQAANRNATLILIDFVNTQGEGVLAWRSMSAV